MLWWVQLSASRRCILNFWRPIIVPAMKQGDADRLAVRGLRILLLLFVGLLELHGSMK